MGLQRVRHDWAFFTMLKKTINIELPPKSVRCYGKTQTKFLGNPMLKFQVIQSCLNSRMRTENAEVQFYVIRRVSAVQVTAPNPSHCSRTNWIFICQRNEWMILVKVTQLYPTLCGPMDYTARGILQARRLEWEAFPFSRGSSQPRGWTQVSRTAGRLIRWLNEWF